MIVFSVLLLSSFDEVAVRHWVLPHMDAEESKDAARDELVDDPHVFFLIGVQNDLVPELPGEAEHWSIKEIFWIHASVFLDPEFSGRVHAESDGFVVLLLSFVQEDTNSVVSCLEMKQFKIDIRKSTQSFSFYKVVPKFFLAVCDLLGNDDGDLLVLEVSFFLVLSIFLREGYGVVAAFGLQIDEFEIFTLSVQIKIEEVRVIANSADGDFGKFF